MKIRNFVFATVGAASLALVLSACGEAPATNNANNKPVNTMPINTSTPINTMPINTATSNSNHGNTTTAPINTKPIDNKPMNTTNAPKPAPTK
jgi:PBP1b-binding outer membrane lipoprotein LpoB